MIRISSKFHEDRLTTTEVIEYERLKKQVFSPLVVAMQKYRNFVHIGTYRLQNYDFVQKFTLLAQTVRELCPKKTVTKNIKAMP
jgi:hypothetical protein